MLKAPEEEEIIRSSYEGEYRLSLVLSLAMFRASLARSLSRAIFYICSMLSLLFVPLVGNELLAGVGY